MHDRRLLRTRLAVLAVRCQQQSAATMILEEDAEQTARRQDRRLDLTSNWKRCMTRGGSICRAVTNRHGSRHTQEQTRRFAMYIHGGEKGIFGNIVMSIVTG